MTCQGFIFKTKETTRILRQQAGALSIIRDLRLKSIEDYIQHAERQIDQIYRRIVLDETIPHAEKVFSIFEPHTEWISKGKAGVPRELGLRVCILKDQHGFILHHRVMEHETDDKVAIPMVAEAKDKFENLSSCSFDKGFYTAQNREASLCVPARRQALAGILEAVILPPKGRLSEKDKQIEHSEGFIKSRRKHSAVESSINALENHGLDRCRDHGLPVRCLRACLCVARRQAARRQRTGRRTRTGRRR